MNIRLKELRRNLNLTQNEFSKKIGIKGNTLSELENGKKPLTDRNIILICKEFNVNENWLKTGKGDMFNQYDKEYEYEYLVGALSASDNAAKKEVIKFIISLDDDTFKKGMQCISELVDKCRFINDKNKS